MSGPLKSPAPLVPSPPPVAAPPVAVALAGCGYWGRNLLRNLREHTSFRLVGVADADPSVQERLRAECPPSCAVAGDFKELLDAPGLEAVVIATPPGKHHPQALAALRRGLHVMVEKPLATSAALAAEICLEAQRHQRVLAVGHIFLHNPAVQAMRQLVISGEVGQLQYIASQRLSLGIVRPDVDAMWNLAPHDIAIAQYLFGAPPCEVSATGTDCLGTGRCDVQALTVRYGRGRAAFHTVSWLHPRKVREVTVVGSRRMMVFDDVAAERKLTVYDKGIDRPATSAEPQPSSHPSLPGFRNFSEFQWVQRAGDIFAPLLPYVEPMTAELADFAACIRTGGTPVADGSSALAVVATLEAASMSLEQGGCMVPVAIPSIDPPARP